MAKKLTITVSDEVYEGLHRRIGRRRIGRFLDNLARPHVTDPEPGDPEGNASLEEQYRAQAAEEAADPRLAQEIREWLDADLGDELPDEDWSWLRNATG